MLNPLKEARLAIGIYTPEKFAQIAGVQSSAIGQAEEGFYPAPLPAYVKALGITPGSKEDMELAQEYREYQLEKRISNGPNLDPKLTLGPVFRSDRHPLLSWREQSLLSTYGFCSAFCVHMPTLNKFEKQITQINEVPPKRILNPLIEAGYGEIEGLLEEFIETSLLYKLYLSNQLREQNNLPLLVG